jgi:adenylate cyclase
MTATAPPEQRVVEGTIMFTDIVGFTEFTAIRGDEEALTLLARQEKIVREHLCDDSRIVKELGDGLMIWFADAREAVETSILLQERFEETTLETDAPLWVRIGVHAGRQTRRGQDLLGHDVNVAARIMDVAGAGEVLVSEQTLKRIEADLPDVAFEQLGPVVMKGIPTPINLYRAERRVA